MPVRRRSGEAVDRYGQDRQRLPDEQRKEHRQVRKTAHCQAPHTNDLAGVSNDLERIDMTEATLRAPCGALNRPSVLGLVLVLNAPSLVPAEAAGVTRYRRLR
jgi:hypothetical protein